MRQKKYRKEIIGLLSLLVLCFVIVFVASEIFFMETGEPVADVVLVDETHFADGYIEVNVRPILLDAERERITLDVEFVPHGRFAQRDGLLSVPVEVAISSVNHTDVFFQAGKRMFPLELDIDFYEGEADAYPFDEHRALLEVLIVEQTSADGNWHSLPTRLNFESTHHGFRFRDKPLPVSEHGYLGLDIHMKRSPLVIGTAIFLMATIWGLTLFNLALFVGVLRGQVEADFSLFGYMSGFIVAMFFFREMFPGIPSFLGVFVDYVCVFWSILVAAGIANLVGLKWLSRVFKNEDKQPDSIG